MSQEETIINILAEHFSVPHKEINIDTHLVNDLNADSLDSIEIVLEVEKAFDIEVDDDDIDAINTVQDIANLVQELS
jgi:acyl carrier protein